MKTYSILFIFLSFPFLALAHGEDKLGPHQGFIRMPGAFHTELVPAGEKKFQVYLLDLDWKNPSIRRSKVNLSLVTTSQIQAECQIENNYYVCQFPAAIANFDNGTLKLTAQRESAKGAEVIYKLPLKLEN